MTIAVTALEQPGLAATALLAFPAGSMFERPDEEGVAHFIEHLVFKGSRRYPTQAHVALASEMRGAWCNAYTTPASVAYHGTGRSRELMSVLDLLCDLVADPLFDEAEIERERGVVLSEIADVEDTPERLAYQSLTRALFAKARIARSNLGTAEQIRAARRETIIAFKERCYRDGQLFLVGDLSHLDHDALDAMLSAFGRALPLPPLSPVALMAPRTVVHQRDTVQSYLDIAFSFADLDATDIHQRAVLELLVAALGDGEASRLWRELRERVGICYSIGVGSLDMGGHCLLNIDTSVAPRDLAEAHERILSVVDGLRAGISELELERARAYRTSAVLISTADTEHVAGQMELYRMRMGIENYTPLRLAQEMETVTRAEVSELAGRLSGDVWTGIAGPHDDSALTLGARPSA